jgi:hypothetical protein
MRNAGKPAATFIAQIVISIACTVQRLAERAHSIWLDEHAVFNRPCAARIARICIKQALERAQAAFNRLYARSSLRGILILPLAQFTVFFQSLLREQDRSKL